MCRLIALPPGTSPELAHELVSNFVRGNDDGVGEAYVVKGEFKINKYPYSYQEAVSKKDTLFSHMPHPGWTIAHVRLKTHGENSWVNTHPFIKGDTAVVHNGIFGAHGLVKAAIGGGVKWSGDCDSEVAAYLFNKLGPDKFFYEMPKSASVYLGLKRDGSLAAVKLGMGDLKVFRQENDTFILASEYPWRDPWYSAKEGAEGVLKLDAEGHALNFNFEKKERKGSSGTEGYGTRRERQSHGACSADARQRTVLTNDDIHRATCQTGNTSGVPLLTNRSVKKELSLWDWPSEEDLVKLENEEVT